MEIKKLYEIGYDEALLGIGLSYGITSGKNIFDVKEDGELRGKLEKIALKLKDLEGGENKFLRQIAVCFDINAPHYWWPQCDQYKVSTTTQSESKMHSLLKKPFSLNDFSFEDLDKSECTLDKAISETEAYNIINKQLSKQLSRRLSKVILEQLNKLRDIYLETKDELTWCSILKLLPQGYNQRRIWTANYAVLRNIIKHRSNHKLHEWQVFCRDVMDSVDYPDLLK